MIDVASRLFSKATRADGRLVVGASLLAYFAFLFVAHFFVNYQRVWQHLGVAALSPTFGDLHNITSAVDCRRAGYDPLVSDPCDPWRRPMNYPRIWLFLFSALHIRQQDTVIAGVCLAVLFYLAVFLFIGRINAYEGGLYTILLCSSAAMLAVERGNNDLIIFLLLTVALLALRQAGGVRWAAYVLFGLCALLKIYPFCVYVLALREKPRASAAVLLASTAIFALYLFLIRDDLRAIQAALPRSYELSYGSHVLFDRLQAMRLPVPASVMPLFAVLCVVGVAYVARRRTPAPILSRWNRESLIMGTLLYVVTFAFGNNYNYRLIFLLFAVPALLELIKTPNPYTRFAGLFLAVMIVSLWLSPLKNIAFFLIKETGNWAMFAALLVLLFHLLPDWFRRRGVAAPVASPGPDAA